ncbi:PDZ domain-containing protein [Streptomyces albofaciens JCM 4342]|uniref:S41 family peptidase n=1 Tax=Streptomyces albofaciens TaxID=66866 RepID=UPI00123B97D1|nr:S41 family peptidase [Streptomyces albofaciens]KAA6221583.1 PDZ domain-containing protein [Streptomyces albofaciens JCM 4342]
MTGPCLFVRPRRSRRGAALTLVFVSVLATGAAAGTWEESGQRPEERRIPERVAAEADRVHHQKRADRHAAGPGAAGEVVGRSGDRWSTAFSAREYEEFQQELDGAYVGVGLWLRQAADGRVLVSRVRPGGPAAAAGVRPGDELRAVDGVASRGAQVTDVVARLRGSAGATAEGPPPGAGSRVELELRRGARQWTETLRRAHLRAQNVITDHPDGPDGPTRIRVGAFSSGTGEEIRRAVRAASPRGGVLLDLRGNTGGLVREAVAAASAFLDGGLVATYDVRGSQRALYAEGGGNTQIPLAVLVDGGTMSAGELLAGALQDRGRAVLVGTPTFGKGSVQLPSRQPDGSVAELTVGRYRTPSGRTVDDRGITPDLIAEDDAQARARTVLSGLGGGA